MSDVTGIKQKEGLVTTKNVTDDTIACFYTMFYWHHDTIACFIDAIQQQLKTVAKMLILRFHKNFK